MVRLTCTSGANAHRKDDGSGQPPRRKVPLHVASLAARQPTDHAPNRSLVGRDPVLPVRPLALLFPYSRAKLIYKLDARLGEVSVRGHVRRRGDPGSWEYIIDVGLAAAQRCTECNRRSWVERRPKESCPSCAGSLKDTEERRRQTKAGFATRKECLAEMNSLLVAVEQQRYRAPTKATVREYLRDEWLPAVKATIRPSTYSSYVQHVECHITPHIGSREAAEALRQPGQRPLREARRDGQEERHERPRAADHPPRPRLPAQGLQGCGQVGTHLEEPARCRRPTEQEG